MTEANESGARDSQPGAQGAHEYDAMTCRACGKLDRASEGYPCAECGTFICLICTFRGVTLCARCAERRAAGPADGGTSGA